MIEEIGQGGMAVVWRGIDTTLKREVAVKILHPHLSRKEANRQRFAREARVVATLHHDNIVEIYDFSGGEGETPGADAYIVCEYIRGRTLADFIERPRTVRPPDEEVTGQSDAAIPTPPIPVEIGVLIAVEICEAVSHAHAQGVVHRDIKPENVMIRQDGVVKLMDFGIARVNDDSGATMTGTLMGSPQYMSPEQAAGQELDARSDLFSIAILVYRLVTGALPFDGPNPVSILRSIGETTPDPADAKNPLVSRALAATIRKGLSKVPDDRHPSVADLRAELLASIADAGLATPREELKRYFADPAGYATALRPQLVTRYTAAGRAKAAKKDLAGAMEVWSRVLELDPNNLEVRAALQNLGKKKRNDRALVMGAGAVALIAVTAFAGPPALRALMSLAPSPTPVAIATTPPPPTSVAPPSPSPSPSASAAATTATPRPSPSVKPSIAPSPVATGSTVAMIASPVPTFPPGFGAIRIVLHQDGPVRIDDEVRGDASTVKKAPITLAATTHHLAWLAPQMNPECETLEGDFEVVEGKEQMLHRLKNSKYGELADEEIYQRRCGIHFGLTGPTLVGVDPKTITAELVDPLSGVAEKLKWDVVAGDPRLMGMTGEWTLIVRAKGYEPFTSPIKLLPKRPGHEDDQVFNVELKKKK